MSHFTAAATLIICLCTATLQEVKDAYSLKLFANALHNKYSSDIHVHSAQAIQIRLAISPLTHMGKLERRERTQTWLSACLFSLFMLI